MTQLVIVPIYHIKTLYQMDKAFYPLNDYLDVDRLLEMCFDPQGDGNKFDIWEQIEVKRSVLIMDRANSTNGVFQELSDQDDSAVYEILDIMLDMFIEVAYSLMNTYFDLNRKMETARVRSFQVKNDSAYILIE